MRKLLVVSHQGGVGKATTATNLATIAALSHRRTLLVNADPHHSMVSALGLDKRSGRSTLSALGYSGPEPFWPDILPRLDLTSAYAIAGEPQSERLDAYLAAATGPQAAARYDCVIVNAPPLAKGGISRMRGVRYGEFDHVVWVTMGKEGPTLANILLDGILPEDLEIREADESGYMLLDRKAVFPVKGTVYLDGVALNEASVSFHAIQGGAPRRTSDGLSEPDGSFVLSTYGPFDGAPAAEYAVTVKKSPGLDGKIKVPEKYGRPDTTPLRASVSVKGPNQITLELTSQ